MFSGKSTELARRIRRHKVANRSCLVVKYAKDTRYESEPGTAEAGTDGVDDLRGCMITHDRQALVAYPTHLLADVDNVAHSFDVIGVDEGQFFPDVVAFCEKWANEGKTVIVAALDGDFKRTPFGAVLGLVPIAEDVTKLSAVCHGCGGDAAFTARAGAVATDEVELIGGSDLGYSASCRACFASGAAAAQAGKSPIGKAAKQKQLQQPSSTPSRPPSSASSAERARAKKRASVDGTPAAAAVTEARAAAATPSTATPSAAEQPVASTPAMRDVGERMRLLTMDSPSTPADSGYTPVAARGTRGRTKMGAAALNAVAGVENPMGGGGKRLARGAGGPGRSPYNELASRGMGAVVRSPLSSVR
jgi:thymidine kinase